MSVTPLQVTNIGSSRHHECEGRHTSCELFIGHNRDMSRRARLPTRAVGRVARRDRATVVRALSVESTDKRDRSLPVAGFKGTTPNLSSTIRTSNGSRCRRSRSLEISEAEAQANCGINVIDLKVAVGQSAVHLCEHQSEIAIPLRCKPPIDSRRNPVERPGAL